MSSYVLWDETDTRKARVSTSLLQMCANKKMASITHCWQKYLIYFEVNMLDIRIKILFGILSYIWATMLWVQLPGKPGKSNNKMKETSNCIHIVCYTRVFFITEFYSTLMLKKCVFSKKNDNKRKLTVSKGALKETKISDKNKTQAYLLKCFFFFLFSFHFY